MVRLLSALLSISLLASSSIAQVASQLRTLTGSHTRVVWCEHQEGGDDVLVRRGMHKLAGFDTDDGLGVRYILEELRGYGKPLITPRGNRVVFTNMGNGRVMVVDWDGSNLRELCMGFCSDVWMDPGTGEEWIYVHRSKHVYRQRIDSPESEEVVWNKTFTGFSGGGWFQVSPDGTRAAGAFPWRDCGAAILPNVTLKVVGSGCWPGMAPDNTYRMWVFDELHRNVMLYNASGSLPSKVDIHRVPGILGWEVYHPRWSNHPSYITVTGPYTGGNSGACVSNDCGELLFEGGVNVEVHLGRFNPGFTEIEEWVRITTDKKGSFYPHAWINPKGTGGIIPVRSIGNRGNRFASGHFLRAVRNGGSGQTKGAYLVNGRSASRTKGLRVEVVPGVRSIPGEE